MEEVQAFEAESDETGSSKRTLARYGMVGTVLCADAEAATISETHRAAKQAAALCETGSYGFSVGIRAKLDHYPDTRERRTPTRQP